MTNGRLQFNAAIEETLRDELADIEERRANGEEVDAELDDRVSVEFGLANDPMDETFEAFEPTPSQIALFMAAGDGDTIESVGALFGFLKATLSPASYRRLRQRIASNNRFEHIEVEGLVSVMKGVTEHFVGSFPTKPSPAATPSRPSTGSRSTGRSPGKTSTRSVSSRAASSATSTRGRTSA